jgi:hypothetical protein
MNFKVFHCNFKSKCIYSIQIQPHRPYKSSPYYSKQLLQLRPNSLSISPADLELQTATGVDADLHTTPASEKNRQVTEAEVQLASENIGE